MSNLLEVAMIDAILSLHHRNWSQRRIASELGINRETVARYLKQAVAASKPANAPPGSAASEAAPKPANAPSGSGTLETEPKPSVSPLVLATECVERGGRQSECEPWRDVIRSMCELGLSAQRIHQDLPREHNFTGSD